MTKILTILALSLPLTGCVTNIGFLGMASTQPELQSNVKYVRLGTCKATDRVFIFFVPWGISRIETALKSCLDKYPTAAYISNASVGVYQNNWVFFAWTGFQVEGTVYGRPKGKETQPAPEETFLLRESQDGLKMVSAEIVEPVIALR